MCNALVVVHQSFFAMASLCTGPNDQGPPHVLALNEMLIDFEMKQRGLLLVAIDTALNDAMKQQSAMLQAIRSKVIDTRLNGAAAAAAAAVAAAATAERSMMTAVISRTMDVQTNTGLVSWIKDDRKKQLVVTHLATLRTCLEAGRGVAFRSAFDALVVVYMECLEIPMLSGSRRSSPMDELQQGLLDKAGDNGTLIILVHRVYWACFGVRAICAVRARDTHVLSENEMLELCACFSAIGAEMPTLALEFQACQQPSVTTSSSSSLVLPS